MTGKTLGHYRIDEKLGEGGMGVVYRAHDTQLERTVALKLVGERLPADETARARLLQEARSASALNHPHISTIYEVGEADGQTYIAMEYAEGRSLSALIPSDGMPMENLLRYGTQIADALAHAHERGIIHRDLKSSNVVITADGRAKVLDFGLAKRLPEAELEEVTRSKASLTEAGAVVGTLSYMSPEVLCARTADARTDIWALGVVLYEMATGNLPFRGQTGFELSSAILREPPPPMPPRVPAGLRAVILRCLAKEPGERYGRASEVRAALEAIQSGAAALPVGAPLALPLQKRWGIALVAAVGALLALLVGLNVGRLRDRLGRRASSRRIESLAVLPLTNLSGDPEQEYFADGMTEELITDLAKIGALKVISRTSVMHYKGSAKTVPEIAKELGVDAVVEGSVQRSGSRVRITAQLIHAATDRHVWAESYERELKDLLSLQDEVARAIADEIRVTLTPQERIRLANASAVKPEAYETYLRGLYRYRKANDEEKEAAIAMFEQATGLDPQFALAHAALAEAYVYRYFRRDPKKEWEERAFVEIEKALSLDPNLAEAYVARGNLAWTLANHFPHERAVQDFRHALALKPSLADAHFALGHVYYHVGLLEKSLEELQAAVALDPHNIDAAYRIARVHMYQRKYELALSEFERLSEAPPIWYWQKALALFYLGRQEEAEALVEDAVKNAPRNEDLASVHALLLAASGHPAKAQEQIRNAIKFGQGRSHFHHSEYIIASAFAFMGNHGAALKWLRKAAEDGFPCYPVFEKDPNLKNLRDDPDYLRLMDTLRRQWEQFSRTL